MNLAPTEMAFVLEGVGKTFKKSSRRKDSSTLKSEFMRILLRRRKVVEPTWTIEALSEVNLAIPRAKTIGIIGRNGSGKSTLLKLMTGIYSPSKGSIRVNGRISALLELGAGFHPEFTGRENIFINGIILGMSRAELKDRVEDIIRFAELRGFIDEPVRTYSSGMFMRLAFAVATHVDPDILIIDEILSVGDEHFQHKSSAKMQEFRDGGRTIVLVTHDLGTVESWCDLAAWIDGGKVRMMGDPKEVVREYRRAVAVSEAQAPGQSLLSISELALPDLAPAPPIPVTLSSVRLHNGRENGSPPAFSSSGRLHVLLDYAAREASASDFVVEIRSADGGLVFGTSLAAETPAGQGTVTLEVPRLSLGEGAYEVLARLVPRNHRETPPLRASLVVAASADAASGPFRPEHRWSVSSRALALGLDGSDVVNAEAVELGVKP